MHCYVHIFSFSSKMVFWPPQSERDEWGEGRKCHFIYRHWCLYAEAQVKTPPRDQKRRKIRLPQTGKQLTLDQGCWGKPQVETLSYLKEELSLGVGQPGIRVNVYLASLLAKHFAKRFPCVISCSLPNSPFLCYHWSYQK